jgi:hypothetical protein
VGGPTRTEKGEAMKNEKKASDTKKGTLRPWLVDVQVDTLR